MYREKRVGEEENEKASCTEEMCNALKTTLQIRPVAPLFNPYKVPVY